MCTMSSIVEKKGKMVSAIKAHNFRFAPRSGRKMYIKEKLQEVTIKIKGIESSLFSM